MTHAACCWCSSPLVKVLGVFWACPTQACLARQLKHAQWAKDAKGQPREMVYLPLPKQTVWHEAVYDRTKTRLLIGGAAGPGKSTCIRRILYELAGQIPGFHALLLRKTHKDLDKSHVRFMQFEVPLVGGEWKSGDRIAVFRHPGQMDAIIRAGHFEDATAIEDYLSSEFDCIAPDEVVTLEEEPTLELFTRARSTNPVLFELRGNADDELDGSFVLAGSNPGGRMWVRDHWILKSPDPEQYPHYNPARWAFYDARLRDNPYLRAGYVENLRGLREARRRQLEDGDWEIFEGQFFSQWQPIRHGEPWHVGEFERFYPGLCLRDLDWFVSLDGGFNAPHAAYWWFCLPDGRFHIRREWKEAGVYAEDFAKGFWRISREELGLTSRPRYVVAGGDIDQRHGLKGAHGETVYETLQFYGLPMKRADRDRINGWYRTHELLRPSPFGTPWLTTDPSCKYLIRTTAAAPRDPGNEDEIDPKFSDDHGLESRRYGAMSRPSPTRFASTAALKPNTAGALLQDALIASAQVPVLGSSAVRTR